MPRVRTNDVETYYERRGDGPPVVFVHGAVVDHGQWGPQADALSDEFTTVAYDVRGHGRTGGSARESYSVDLYAEDLDALIAALDLDRPVVCGLSMGGCIAQAYATRYPDRLAGLVLVDTFTAGEDGLAERLQFALLRASILPARLVGYERVERAMVWLQTRVGGKEVAGDYGNVVRLREDAPRMATAEFAKVIRSLAAFRRADLDLSAVAVPTLILYGEHEVGFVKRHAATMAAAIPGARVRAVPDAGHVSNLDNPGAVTSALRSFLTAVASGDATRGAADGSGAPVESS